MIKLTEKGKSVYGIIDIKPCWCRISEYDWVMKYGEKKGHHFEAVANNPTELKALVDMGLIEIE